MRTHRHTNLHLVNSIDNTSFTSGFLPDITCSQHTTIFCLEHSLSHYHLALYANNNQTGRRGARPLTPRKARRHPAEVPPCYLQLHRQEPRGPQDGELDRGGGRPPLAGGWARACSAAYTHARLNPQQERALLVGALLPRDIFASRVGQGFDERSRRTQAEVKGPGVASFECTFRTPAC